MVELKVVTNHPIDMNIAPPTHFCLTWENDNATVKENLPIGTMYWTGISTKYAKLLEEMISKDITDFFKKLHANNSFDPGK